MFILVYQVTSFRCSNFKGDKNATSNKKDKIFCIGNI